MEIFDLETITRSDVFSGIGAIIAGLYYGMKTFKSKKNDEVIDKTETELINILRNHVEDEKQLSKDNILEIKEHKKNISSLENELDILKKENRKYKDYIDKLSYFCQVLPKIDGDFNNLVCGEQVECQRTINSGTIVERRNSSGRRYSDLT